MVCDYAAPERNGGAHKVAICMCNRGWGRVVVAPISDRDFRSFRLLPFSARHLVIDDGDGITVLI